MDLNNINIESLNVDDALKSQTKKLFKLAELLEKTSDAINNNDFELANTLSTMYDFEKKYDKILANFILPYNEILELFYYFNSEEDYNKVLYLSWLLNTYYNKNIICDMEDCVEIEDYENAAVLRDIQSITNMPQNKE